MSQHGGQSAYQRKMQELQQSIRARLHDRIGDESQNVGPSGATGANASGNAASPANGASGGGAAVGNGTSGAGSDGIIYVRFKV